MGLFGTLGNIVKGVANVATGGVAGTVLGAVGGLLDGGPTNQTQVQQGGTTGGTTSGTAGFDPNSQAFIDAQRLQAIQAQQALQNGGSVTAGLDPLSQQAGQQAGQQGQLGLDLFGQGNQLFQQFFPQAGQSTIDAAQQFQNPFQQQAIDASNAQFQNTEAFQQNALADQAIAAGAFGGDRFGVATGIRQAQGARDQNSLISQMLSEQFNRNIGFAQQDRNLALGALGQGFNAQQGGANIFGQSTGLLGQQGAFQRQVEQEQLRDDLFRAQQGQGLLQGGSGNFGTTSSGTSAGTTNQTGTKGTPAQSALQRILAGAATGAGIGDILRNPDGSIPPAPDEIPQPSAPRINEFGFSDFGQGARF